MTHSSNYLCLNGLPPPSLSLSLSFSLCVHEWESNRDGDPSLLLLSFIHFHNTLGDPLAAVNLLLQLFLSDSSTAAGRTLKKKRHVTVKQHISREGIRVVSAPRTAASSFIVKGYGRVKCDHPWSTAENETLIIYFRLWRRQEWDSELKKSYFDLAKGKRIQAEPPASQYPEKPHYSVILQTQFITGCVAEDDFEHRLHSILQHFAVCCLVLWHNTNNFKATDR